MLKLKFFSIVSIFILILSSCEYVEDESITPIDDTSINGYQIEKDSINNTEKVNFTQLPDKDSNPDYEIRN
ncbi:hypothetical protein AVL50_23695 [Flammeovirga sp. SJP92]|nr:hypothetical protein AVL50_23695 [Flammeovirga sp. SJP92]